MNTKPQYRGQWVSTPAPFRESPHLLTRSRAAYLLRAARSRRRGNVQRSHGFYLLRDCGYTLTRA